MLLFSANNTGPLCEILFVEAKKVFLHIILKSKNLDNIYFLYTQSNALLKN